MFLKKIVDFISYNQQLNSSDNISGSPTEKYEDAVDRITEDTNEDNLSSSSIGGETSVLDFCFLSPNKYVDKTTGENEANISEDNSDQNFLYSSAACEQGDKFKTKILDEYISDTKNCRNIFTQTEAKLDRRRHSSLVMHPHKHAHIQKNVESDKKSKSFPVCVTETTKSAFFPQREKLQYAVESVVYGTLFVFGCNRSLPDHLNGALNSKFVLRKRLHGNGLKEAFSYVRSDDKPVSISPAKHVISYPISSKVSIDVAFQHDSTTDMFQIGRYEKLPIDFRVDDMNPVGKARHGVSRFACRILVRREENHEARVYAAAFDSTHTIFLGEESIPCKYRGKMDGFTTNGVLILHPGGCNPGIWREVSVGGYIYPLRSCLKVEASNRPRINEESNILQDGTLIDLCGVTLLWRTPEGLKNTPNEEYLSRLQSTIHKSVPECQLLTLDSNLYPKWSVKKAYIYISCGHVVGLALPKIPENRQGWSCPVCRVIGPISVLTIGAEPGFYLDTEFPSYAFKPCGHVASLKTVDYWSSVKIPQHRNIQDSFCPFCGTKLNYISKYVKLIFPAE